MTNDPMNNLSPDSAAAAATRTIDEAGNAAQAMGKKFSDMGQSMMGEFTKLFADMKAPGMPDMDALMSAHRRNLETLTAANRVALEGAQAVARRNMEIMQQTMAELTDGMRQMATGDAPQARATKQAEMLKSAYERAVANMKEISELIQESSGEALGLLNTRFAEAVDEVKQLTAKTTQA